MKLSINSLVALLLLAAGSVQAETCVPLQDNEYEKIYCEVKRKGKGDSLPGIYEFRKNSPMTQAILLKKPAERAGIIVKMPERENQETLQRQEDILVTNVPANTRVTAAPGLPPAPTSPPAVKTHKEQPAVLVVTKTAPLPVATASLDGCSLQQLTLLCADVRYQLVGNKSNQQLPEEVLSDAHKLDLPVFTGDPTNAAALDAYLAQAYGRYLQGMLEIGLGGSTMTYTKFANLYQYISEQRLDFAARFETMYHFLKKDKSTIGVSTRLAIAEGFSLQYCNQLENMVACDHQKTNYIFVKQSP